MAAINNLKGTPVKDGKVVYSEQLETSLHFAVILMYEPFYEGKNTANHQHSTQLYCEAVITTGSKHTWGNGIHSLDEADWFEKVRDNEKFKPLKSDLKTKDGFRVWQVEYSFGDFEITKEQFEKSKNSNYDFLSEIDKNDLQKQGKIKFKTRRVKWLVEVPKMSMLKFCGVS